MINWIDGAEEKLGMRPSGKSEIWNETKLQETLGMRLNNKRDIWNETK